ncbi:MAG TPA: hypothetical protein VFQ53_30780 [Kofleriaceae bacterium]|nr:hypothetical protein [Kofleriaceae bacterium]
MNKLGWLVVLGVGAWWLWPASSASKRAVSQQAAVLPDGFAVLDSDGRHRVHELDDDGAHLGTTELPALPRELRLVGTAAGPAVAWVAGKQVALASIDMTDSPRKFGKSVALLCAGAASNEHKFGVAWIEKDGSLWFVHGPTSRAAELPAIEALPAVFETDDATAKVPDHCAVASADDKLAFLWRDGNRVSLLRCGRSCESRAHDVKLPKGGELRGFGCTKDACVVVARRDGTTTAHWLDAKGKVVWSKPLPDARADTAVSVVGAGTQIAIAYGIDPEPVVRIASRGGELRAVWQGTSETEPALAWSGRTLLVAYQVGGELGTAILRP